MMAQESEDSFRREASHGAILVAAQVVTGVLTLLYSVLVGRALGPEDSADFFAALFLVFAFGTVASSINSSTTRFTSVHVAAGEDALVFGVGRHIVRLLAGIGLVVGIAGVVFADALSAALGISATGAATVAVASGAVALVVNVPRGVLRGRHQFAALSLNLVTEAALRLVLGAILLGFLASASAALLAYPLALMVAVVLGLTQMGGVEPNDGPPLSAASIRMGEKEIGSLVGPLLIFALASAGFANADVLLVQRYFADAGVTGPYGAAATLARMFAALVIPFQVLLLPVLTVRHTRGTTVARPFLRITGLFLLLCVPALGVFGLWGEQLIRGLYGVGFASAAPILVPLSLTVIVGALSTLVGQAFVSLRTFEFLGPYAIGFAVELYAVSLRHSSPAELVNTVLWVKLVTLLVMAIHLAICIRKQPPSTEGDGKRPSSPKGIVSAPDLG